MLSRWDYVAVPSLINRLTLQAGSLVNVKKFQLNRFMPSKSTRGVLPDGLLLTILDGQLPLAIRVIKERQYDIGLTISSISSYNMGSWSYRMWSFFFQQTEQLSVLKTATGQRSDGYFRSRFRRYVFFEETLWLRTIYKNSINNVFLNFSIPAKIGTKTLLEFFLRFFLLPLKFRLSLSSRKFSGGLADRTNHLGELFKRFRWLKAYRSFLPWTLRKAKVLQVKNEVKEPFLLGYFTWIFKYRSEQEKKREGKKKSKRQQTNTRFKRRRFGKKRRWLKNFILFRQKRKLMLNKRYPVQILRNKTFSHYYHYFWASILKVALKPKFINNFVLRKFYWDFLDMKKRYQSFLFYKRKQFNRSSVKTYFLV